MATAALYRRYRPRRFSELKGQDHIVAALRNSIINGREGQAYLFSGPRGTGKTTTARILAKVLNCTNLIEGEPCCECDSCIAVEKGTSYDVHELDAASNNGVEAMRDLIDKARLGTPGRHKVYILDEVHMLSKGAEATLLKTLEEPPPHVVFVLATTDPQKVSETIISRCQSLQFHLLPMDVMESHVRWLAGDAGIDLDDDALDAVLRQGRGSARDTLSALELVATSGGRAPEAAPLDEFVEALIERDAGRALTAVAASTNLGRDARTLAEELVGHLRDCFLSLMAPELVMLPDRRAGEVAAIAQRLGAALAVRAIESIGSTLVEMRHAPDPRVLLEVALVKLTAPSAEAGTAGLIARIERLEQQLAAGGRPPAGRETTAAPGAGDRPGGDRPGSRAGGGPVSGTSMRVGTDAAASTRPGGPDGVGNDVSARADAGSGARPVMGGRLANRATTSSSSPADRSGDAGAGESSFARRDGGGGERGAEPAAAAPQATSSDRPRSANAGPRGGAIGDDASGDDHGSAASGAESRSESQAESRTESSTDPSTGPDRAGGGAGSAGSQQHDGGPVDAGRLSRAWSDIVLPGLRPLVKALYSAGRFEHRANGPAVILPNEMHRRRCEEYLAVVNESLSNAVGSRVSLTLVADSDAGPGSGAPGRSSSPSEPDDEVFDPAELTDAPVVPRASGIDRVTAAFPGAQLVDEES